MKILVTGAKGFVGKNLCAALKNLKDGKDTTRPALTIEDIYEYDIDNNPIDLETYCAKADFVFNLAGVNRPKTQEEFMQGNFGFASLLLDTLKKHGNKCPIILSSSIQASLIGRYADANTEKARKPARSFFSIIKQMEGGMYAFTAFQTSLGSGAGRIITAPSRPFVIILQTTC